MSPYEIGFVKGAIAQLEHLTRQLELLLQRPEDVEDRDIEPVADYWGEPFTITYGPEVPERPEQPEITLGEGGMKLHVSKEEL